MKRKSPSQDEPSAEVKLPVGPNFRLAPKLRSSSSMFADGKEAKDQANLPVAQPPEQPAAKRAKIAYTIGGDRANFAISYLNAIFNVRFDAMRNHCRILDEVKNDKEILVEAPLGAVEYMHKFLLVVDDPHSYMVEGLTMALAMRKIADYFNHGPIIKQCEGIIQQSTVPSGIMASEPIDAMLELARKLPLGRVSELYTVMMTKLAEEKLMYIEQARFASGLAMILKGSDAAALYEMCLIVIGRCVCSRTTGSMSSVIDPALMPIILDRISSFMFQMRHSKEEAPVTARQYHSDIKCTIIKAEAFAALFTLAPK